MPSSSMRTGCRGYLPEQELDPKAPEAVALLALVAGQDVELPRDRLHIQDLALRTSPSLHQPIVPTPPSANGARHRLFQDTPR